jgi:hypothetical protein
MIISFLLTLQAKLNYTINRFIIEHGFPDSLWFLSQKPLFRQYKISSGLRKYTQQFFPAWLLRHARNAVRHRLSSEKVNCVGQALTSITIRL